MARIALCQEVMFEYMGYQYISAVLKADGHEVELFLDPQVNEGEYVEEIRRFEPDVVGFSVISPSLGWATRVARKVKDATGAVTVFGNVHAIISPDVIEEEGLDVVCITEGEYAMRELARRMDAKLPYDDIPGFWVKTGDGVKRNERPEKTVELESLPYLDRDLYDKYPYFRKSRYMRFTMGRGCPFHCSFCTNKFFLDYYGSKNFLRKLSPERAIEELAHHVARRKPEYLIFGDEVLWVKNSWLREFLTLYKERIGLPFTAFYRFGPIEESDIKLLADAGAFFLSVATETGDEEKRMKYLEKPVKDADIIRICGWLNKYGIKFSISELMGFPGDTFDKYMAELPFYHQVKPTYAWTTFFQPYPGVKLSKAIEMQGNEIDPFSFDPTSHTFMFGDLDEKDRVVNLKKVFHLMVVWPWSVPFFRWLTRFNVPLLFDLIFYAHFARYLIVSMRLTPFQLARQVWIFVLLPFLRNLRAKMKRSGTEPIPDGASKTA